jgi:hypothetical protein
VRRDGNVFEDPLHVVLAEAVVEQALARAVHDELLRAGACSQALRGDADEPARAGGGRNRHAVQRVDLLRQDPGDRRWLVLGVAGGDRHLGTLGLLALAHELGDARGDGLGLEARLAEHDLADDLVDDLLEARHMRALLLRPEVDEALQAGREQLLLAVLADADDLLDLRDPDARQADAQARYFSLDVGVAGAQALRHALSVSGVCARSAF